MSRTPVIIRQAQTSAGKKRDTSGTKAIHNCNSCGKSFTTKFNLKRHINMHCHKSRENGVPIQGPPSASAPAKKNEPRLSLGGKQFVGGAELPGEAAGGEDVLQPGQQGPPEPPDQPGQPPRPPELPQPCPGAGHDLQAALSPDPPAGLHLRGGAEGAREVSTTTTTRTTALSQRTSSSRTAQRGPARPHP